jgi:hypothetical protein
MSEEGYTRITYDFTLAAQALCSVNRNTAFI